MTDELLKEIAGAAALTQRFGHWPSFHDAEIVEVCLRRTGNSTLLIHTFRMTSELTLSGHFVCDLHTLVTFSFNEILGSHLQHFNNQNVISGLTIEKREDGFELILHPCHGLTGTIRAASIAVSFVDGIPPESVYAPQ